MGFSPDSEHLGFAVARGGKKLLVCDGIEGPEHDEILIPERFADVPGKLRYVTIDAGKETGTKDFYLVEVDWPAGLNWQNRLKPPEPAD